MAIKDCWSYSAANVRPLEHRARYPNVNRARCEGLRPKRKYEGYGNNRKKIKKVLTFTRLVRYKRHFTL